jgi:DNA modification methylase
MKLNQRVPVSRRAPHRERLAVTYRDVRHLRPDPANARVHSAKQVKQIASSIDRLGFLAPILTDETESLVIAGHGRLQAAIQLGLHEVPTISVKHLTEAQQSAYRIADNQISLNATWDDRLLGEQLLALSLADLDFDLTVTGFDAAQIDLIIQGLDAAASGPDPDDAPLDLEPAVSQLGDLWELGSHRVMCADALDRRSYEALMPDEEAAVVFADPPYNTRVSSVSGKGKRKYREFAMASGEMSRREFTDFLRSAFCQMADRSRDGAIHFICMDFRNMAELLAAGDGVYSELKNLVVWAKNNGGMGSLYRSRHELIFVFKAGTAAHCNNVELGRFGRNRTNVWEYASTNAFGRSSEEGDLTTEHPTSKPVAMIADALLDVSSRGDLVLDPFLGSGSTLMAAERVGRIARGMDLDPRYVDLTIRRWERKTGRSAVHEAMQLTFAEVRELRSEGRHE